jgi:hypothetical protein
MDEQQTDSISRHRPEALGRRLEGGAIVYLLLRYLWRWIALKIQENMVFRHAGSERYAATGRLRASSVTHHAEITDCVNRPFAAYRSEPAWKEKAGDYRKLSQTRNQPRFFSSLRPMAYSLWPLLPVALLLASAQHLAAQQTQQTVTNSEFYRIHSDLPPQRTADYAKRLDAMYREYARRLAGFDVPPTEKFAVHLFKKQADYRNFVGNNIPHSAGMFIPAQRTLAGYEEAQGPDGLRKTLQHEAFHQFAYETISKDLPIWLDEGLAQVFEEGIWTGDRFLLGQVTPARIQDIQADRKARRFVPFATFLNMSRNTFQQRMTDPQQARAQYNQAWAMTHFLVFAPNPDGTPRFRARLIAWLGDLHNNQPAENSFTTHFGTNITGFEERFNEWLKTLRPTPIAVYADRMSKLGYLIRVLHGQNKRFSTPLQLRDYLSNGQIFLTQERDGKQYTFEENALTYLNDIADKPWSSDRLRFEPAKGPLPDIVLKTPESAIIRVRFHGKPNKLEHDLIFE